MAVKINDEPVNHLLATEVVTLQAACAQALPEPGFGMCHVLAQFLCLCIEFRRYVLASDDFNIQHDVVFLFMPLYPPQPLPKGRGCKVPSLYGRELGIGRFRTLILLVIILWSPLADWHISSQHYSPILLK